jgi:hypothetical protein
MTYMGVEIYIIMHKTYIGIEVKMYRYMDVEVCRHVHARISI